MADNKEIISALRENDGAAFGVFPQMRPRRSNQDPEAAKNLPIDVARGFVSGVLGMPGDLEAFFRDKTYLPTSADVEKRLPFKSDTPLGNAATGLGQVGGQMYNGPLSAPRAVSALSTALRRGGEDFLKASGGSVSRVVPVDVAKNLNTKLNLPTDDVFSQAVANTPGAKVTENGLIMNLQRNQKPEMGMNESVRTGVFYLPEGAAQGKHYTSGASGYGGTEKITGETMLSNPLFVKGATGGKAPEAAYDSLVGKGAYQAMRDDVLKSYGYNSNHSQKVEAIQGILEKYNGLDADDAYNMAYNIVSNSKTGNQLPYAVQENIVAHAVRNAGHDAVLGHSKGKSGPFLSEVFDVRESHYPDKFGGYEIFDQFKK